MTSARKFGGWIAAILLIAFFIYILFICFKLYRAWMLLYIPETAILLMCLYVFFPAFLFLIGYYRIKKMFASALSEKDIEKNYITILIPAHNEERLLPILLESINKQTYSKEYYQILVVADNCKDDTYQIAKKYGAFCLERTTGYPSNKQEALRHAIQYFDFSVSFQQGYVCIIDADCETHPDFLREMNQQLLKNTDAVAVQSYRYVKNIYESNVTLLDAAAEALRNWVFCAPRYWIGASVFINGSGILFKKSLFDKLINLPGYHLAEDKEWKAYLSEHNIKVEYCASSQLGYEAVTSQKDFQKQRKRWVGSHIFMMRKYGWKTLVQSVLNLNIVQFDFFCSLMQLPRSLLLAFCLLFSALNFLIPSSSIIPPGGWIIVIAALVLYGVLGLYLIKARAKDYLVLPFALNLLSGILKTTFLSITDKKVSKWEATRSESNE